MSLESLHLGVPVPEYSITLPWLVSRRSLYRYIPKRHFKDRSGNWPALEFTCLGIKAEFGFNFVTHPDRKLVGITMDVYDLDYHVHTIDAVPVPLLERLGKPTRHNTHTFRWWDDRVVVDCDVAISRRQPDEPKRYWLMRLEICYSEGVPLHWNHPEVRKHPPYPFPGHFKG